MNTKEKLIQAWVNELELDPCQEALFCSLAFAMTQKDLARPFIEQDLANGKSIRHIMRKYQLTIRVVVGIREKAGYSGICKPTGPLMERGKTAL